LAKGETCHPSDNIPSVLAASEYARQSGQTLLAALAVAYQVQCCLSDVAPVRAKGFDHTTQGSYAVAAGVSKALGLDEVRTAHAVAICGTAFNALRVTRTGALSHWKGLAYPNTAFACTHAAFLAMRGITGPLEVLEGNKGFMEAIAGEFKINWLEEGLERVTQTTLKRYNAEIHSQSALEGILELKSEYAVRAEEVTQIEIEIFDVAYHIIGGGEEGDKTLVRTKEEADSLKKLIDGGANMGELAKKHSLRPDVPRNNGGRATFNPGNLEYGDLTEDVKKADLFKLTGPVKVSKGYSIFKVLRRTDEAYQSFDKVEKKARDHLKSELTERYFEELLESLRGEYAGIVTVYDEALKYWNPELEPTGS